jgi:hypothetical protein
MTRRVHRVIVWTAAMAAVAAVTAAGWHWPQCEVASCELRVALETRNSQRPTRNYA